MPGTFSQIYIQIVFAVKGRENLIGNTWKTELQEAYGAFSYSHSHIGKVYDYILNQEKHHQKKTFKEEYMDFWKNLK